MSTFAAAATCDQAPSGHSLLPRRNTTASNAMRSVIPAIILCVPTAAQAHVKWFCGPIDPALPPISVEELVTPLYLLCLAAFTLMVVAGGLADRLIATAWPAQRDTPFQVPALIPEMILRIAIAAYMVCLWTHLAVVPWGDATSGAILTLEMTDGNAIVRALQVGISLVLLIPRCSLIASGGILTLYLIGVAKYGAFYMIDYVFFIGIAAYLALSDPLLARYPRLQDARGPMIIAVMSFSLMWAALDKFLFPQWTMLILLEHPGVAGGRPFNEVVILGAYIEFSLGFYFLVGRDVLGRLATLIFIAILCLAMPAFGWLDVVGHIPVIAALLVVALHGETRLQRWIRGNTPRLSIFAGKLAAGFVVMLTCLTSLYYGLYALSVFA